MAKPRGRRTQTAEATAVQTIETPPIPEDVEVLLNTRDVLLHMAKRRGGVITPAEIVEAARASDHPLHERFEWRDDVAAEKFRLVQAMVLIRACKIRIETSSGPRVIRELINVERGTHQYVHATLIGDNESRRLLALERAYREFLSWQQRHEDLVAVFGESGERIKQSILEAMQR